MTSSKQSYRFDWRLATILFLSWLLSGCGINNIPTYDEQVKAAWAQVENQYQRRADLIPNLVESVKGYAQQERETLTAVIEARAKATSIQVDARTVDDPQKLQQFQQAQDQLSGALSRLMAVSERYPELKSNQNFLALQSQLEGTNVPTQSSMKIADLEVDLLKRRAIRSGKRIDLTAKEFSLLELLRKRPAAPPLLRLRS